MGRKGGSKGRGGDVGGGEGLELLDGVSWRGGCGDGSGGLIGVGAWE